MNKRVFVLIVSLMLLLGSLNVFACASQTFTVPPETKQTIKVDLVKGESVNGTLSVVGGTGTGVDFSVTNPDGKELLSYNYTSNIGFSFSAAVNGTYILGFDNSFCSCAGGKNVTLNYSISNPAQLSMQNGLNGMFLTEITLIAVITATAVSAVVFVLRRLKPTAGQAKVNGP